MKRVHRSHRNGNPHLYGENEKKKTPFFSKEIRTPFFNKGIQTKSENTADRLTVGKPGDKYEKEADAMADAVVNHSPPKPTIQNKEISTIQRESLATPLEDEKLGTAEQRVEEDKLVQEKPELQKLEKPEEEEVAPIQTRSDSNNQTARTGVSQSIKSKSGKGKNLPKNTKAEMEASFGTDFSGVNIHTDERAVSLNKALKAQAFTYGKDIYFNSGKYNPNTTEGKRLLAHELTHVVQQTEEYGESLLTKKKIQRKVSTFCNPPSHWGMHPSSWITLGILAHLLGQVDYMSKMGGARGVDLYFDNFAPLPVDPLYAAFIIRHNPGLSAWKKVFLSLTPLKRPDYMVHRPGLTEFDELKPDSIPGVVDGMTKLGEISAYMAVLGLPYHVGSTYKPSGRIPLFRSSLGGTPFEVSIKFTRKAAGLVVYEYCITTDWAKVAKAALVALVVILLIIFAKKLPIPRPVPAPLPA